MIESQSSDYLPFRSGFDLTSDSGGGDSFCLPGPPIDVESVHLTRQPGARGVRQGPGLGKVE